MAETRGPGARTECVPRRRRHSPSNSEPPPTASASVMSADGTGSTTSPLTLDTLSIGNGAGTEIAASTAYHCTLFADRGRLLELCDDVRDSLRETGGMGARHAEMSALLTDMLAAEESNAPSVDFATVQRARLDRLLADVAEMAGIGSSASGAAPDLPTALGGPGSMPAAAAVGAAQAQGPNAQRHAHPRSHLLPARLRADVYTANMLQRKWQSRFKERYFSLEQARYADLPRTGLLRGVEFVQAGDTRLAMWRAKSAETSELEGNLQFETGHWWLNLACAHRDGIVDSEHEEPTKGMYGVMTVPLITGSEEMLRPDCTLVLYSREGSIGDMHLILIPQVGRQVRILRGYRLKSVQAPEAGVRYDGLYVIRQYGTKLDDTTGTFRLRLTLERVAAEDPPLGDIARTVPRPSQLDDWRLYQQLEGELVRHAKGYQVFLD